MQIAYGYMGLMLLMILGLWAQERWGVGSIILELLGMCWIAMMRHTGDPRYTHKARRYR